MHDNQAEMTIAMSSEQGHPRRLPRLKLPPETDQQHKRTADEDTRDDSDWKKKNKKHKKRKETDEEENKVDEINKQTERAQINNDLAEVSKF